MTVPLPRNAGRTAAAIGCTVQEYSARLAAGEKWCGGCKTWHTRDVFGRDASRSDGLTSRCRISKNGHPDHPTPTNRPRGRSYVAARDNDRVQARRRVNWLVEVGVLPSPSALPCLDCERLWDGTGPRHQYDHHLGYSSEHHEHVEVVCTGCHYSREYRRGAHANAERHVSKARAA